jgi:hypothetical protein
MICDEDQERRVGDRFGEGWGSMLGCKNNRRRNYFELAH